MQLAWDNATTGMVMEIVQNFEHMARATDPRIYRVARACKLRPTSGHCDAAFTLEKAREVARRANLLAANFDHWVERIDE